ncbi:dTDP-4-dehydrorhamnose 3,5-epimerase [Methylothermus subterraneus]
MKVLKTPLEGVLLIEPDVYGDARGFFMETWNLKRYREAGIRAHFVQDNLSLSRQGILRGLHYQWPHPQGKLVQVLRGAVFDVAVDIRKGSPTFGRWVGYELSEANHRQLYIPEGFAHGFCVLSPEALFAYKCTDFYHPEAEHSLRWDDPELRIAWPVAAPILSVKDQNGSFLKDLPDEALPVFRPDSPL